VSRENAKKQVSQRREGTKGCKSIFCESMLLVRNLSNSKSDDIPGESDGIAISKIFIFAV
jgi:hypothetical protein